MTQEIQVFILLRDGDTVCINFQRILLPPHHFLNKPLKRSHFLQLNFLEEISSITHLFMYLILETFRGFFYVSSPCEKSPFHPGEDDSFLLVFVFFGLVGRNEARQHQRQVDFFEFPPPRIDNQQPCCVFNHS